MTDNIAVRWIVLTLVLGLGFWAWVANDLNLGIDLRGGYTLTYSIDPRSMRDLEDISSYDAMEDMVQVISTRIDGLGVRDLMVRREGDDRILIQAPQMSEAELEAIKERMVQLGKLEFPIGIGKGQQHPPLHMEPGGAALGRWDQDAADAQRQAAIERDRPAVETARAEGRSLGTLVRDGVAYQYIDDDRPTPVWWRPNTPSEVARRKGVSIDDARIALRDAQLGLPYDKNLVEGGWLYYDPEFYYGQKGFFGSDISSVRKDRDRMGQNVVHYTMNVWRQQDFEDYTSKYIGHPMAIVLNGEIWSAPTINSALSDNIQISGGGSGFSPEEQAWLVNCLQAGSLRLRPVFESGVQIDPTLGEDAISRGVLATLIGAILVVVFMIFYYRFSGAIAVIGLAVNLFLLLAILALFQATLTLPGIAGIILTIGMSVDANILIFERIREELAKGKTLIASTQSGFDRAFVAIIDSNLTTILTGVILYKFGVGPIKGFAVTLIAGIVCSLFAALYLSRTLFATALKYGLVSGTLKMSTAFKPDTKFDFLGKRRAFVTSSAVAIVAALAIFYGTGTSKYGLDFTGGTVVRLNLTEALSENDVMGRIKGIPGEKGAKYPAVEVSRLSDKTLIGEREFTSYEVHIQTSAGAAPEDVTAALAAVLDEALGELLSKREGATMREDAPDTWSMRFETASMQKIADFETMLTGFKDSRGAMPLQTARITGIDIAEQKDEFDQTETFATKFLLEINERNLLGQQEVLKDLSGVFAAQLPKLDDGSVDFGISFPKLDFVGPNVVANLKQQAVIAVVLSLIALVIYIWFRFKDIMFGLAASAALFHDVVIALGIVVGVNMLGIVHVPLNLPIIAGFLTLIGYSLNDTIILFDRVRENFGNVKGSFQEVINLSINQTLSRTILTSATTLAVVVVLFAFNYGAESPLEGIAFSLMVGILIGTYSTIFVASPVLIWLRSRQDAS